MRVMTLARSQNRAISKEALWVLSNLISCGFQDSNLELINIGDGEVIRILIDYLSIKEGHRLLKAMLESLIQLLGLD